MKRYKKCPRGGQTLNPLGITRHKDKTSLRLYILVRQAIPMLQMPECFGKEQRFKLAKRLSLAMGNSCDDTRENAPDLTDRDAPPDAQEYEPGCELEYPFREGAAGW